MPDQAHTLIYPLVSKISCGFPVVEFQQASQPLARLDFASRFTDSVFRPRKKNHIPAWSNQSNGSIRKQLRRKREVARGRLRWFNSSR